MTNSPPAGMNGTKRWKYHSRLFAARRYAGRMDARFARAHMLGEPLDGAVLAGAVAAFENDEHARAIGDQRALKLHQFDLQIAAATSRRPHARPRIMIFLVVQDRTF